MKHSSQTNLIESLRTKLQHFDHSPDFGDAEAVAVIRQHLLLRIREAEGLMRVGHMDRAGRHQVWNRGAEAA